MNANRDENHVVTFPGTGRLGVIKPNKRDNTPPRFYGVRRKPTPAEKLEAEIETCLTSPGLAKRLVAEARAARKTGRDGIALRAPIEPLLNADPRATVEALMHPKSPRHPKDRLVRVVRVKPRTSRAANYCKGWMEREWHIYSLQYSKGFVLIDHMGHETSTVFTGIGKVLNAIRSVQMEIL